MYTLLNTSSLSLRRTLLEVINLLKMHKFVIYFNNKFKIKIKEILCIQSCF
jgi:hypothetical protein